MKYNITKASPKKIKIKKRVPYLTRIKINLINKGHVENKMSLELQAFIKTI